MSYIGTVPAAATTGRRRWLVVVPVALAALVALALGAGVHRGPASTPVTATATRSAAAQQPLPTTHPTPAEPARTPPKPDARPALILGIVIAAMVAVLVGMGLLVLTRAGRALLRSLLHRDRPPAASDGIDPGTTPRVLPDELVERVHDAFASAVRRLDAGEDVDAAIVECWRRLERAAADAGVPRRPQDTATDYAVRLLARTPVDAGDLTTLRTLYQRAMFSTSHATEDDRTSAAMAFSRLAAALAPSAGVPR